MTEYAIEADPGRCTASFPTYDTLADVARAVSAPALHRDGHPGPRVLVRVNGGPWEVVPDADVRAEQLRAERAVLLAALHTAQTDAERAALRRALQEHGTRGNDSR